MREPSVHGGASAARRVISGLQLARMVGRWVRPSVLAVIVPLGVAFALPMAAQATTYVGTRDVNGATVDLSITTDGTIGDLTDPNITAFNVKITDGAGTADITNANGEIQISNDYVLSDLVASPTSLTFTGSDCLGPYCQGGDNVLFQKGSIGAGGAFYCLQANACYDYTYEGEGVSSQTASLPVSGYDTAGAAASEQVSQSGSFVVANAVSAVPEPTTWALMLAGIGLLGCALRRKRSTGLQWAR
jgi:hypothetical protein